MRTPIYIRRGNRNNLPALAVGEPGIALDTHEVFVGTPEGNLLVNNGSSNSIINGNFSVNQRVKSGTVVLTAGQYGHDRWKAGSAGCTYTFATANNITIITISAGSLVQIIEGQNLFDGTYTLSWTGTSQGKIGGGIFASSGVTAVATGGNNLSIEFNVGTVSKVQFNKGNTAYTFQPRSFAQELALCQRYYEKSYEYGSLPGSTDQANEEMHKPYSASANGILAGVFKVPKRVSPSALIYASRIGTAGNVRDVDGLVDKPVSLFGTGSNKVGWLDAGAVTSGNRLAWHWIADSEI